MGAFMPWYCKLSLVHPIDYNADGAVPRSALPSAFPVRHPVSKMILQVLVVKALLCAPGTQVPGQCTDELLVLEAFGANTVRGSLSKSQERKVRCPNLNRQ